MSDQSTTNLAARLGALSPEKQALLARKLAERSAARGGVDRERITPRASSDPAPLSYAQELLWLYEQMSPGTDAYNIPMTRRVHGPLDVAALQRAFDTVVARHESLRTRFVEVNGAPRQLIDAPGAVAIEQHDLRSHDASARETAAQSLLERAVRRPFDLSHGTTPRVVLVQLDTDDALLLVVVHHIVFDGGSVGVLFNEIADAYAAARGAVEAPRAPLQIQLADYAAWERATLDDDRLAPSIEFWRNHLAGAPATLELPTDFARPSSTTGPGARHALTLPTETLNAVRALAAAHDATPFVVLISALHVLLSRYSGQRDIVVGTTVAGRARPGTEPLIGYLANTLAIRAISTGDETFGELVARVRRGVTTAFDHTDVPYERLVRELRGGQPSAEQALFRVMFTLQDAGGVPSRLGEATLSPVGVALGAAKFDLAISAVEVANGLRIAVEYRSDLFRADTIERLIVHFGELLRAAAAAPSAATSSLEFLTAAERKRLLVELNATDAAWPVDATIHELFAEQANRRGDAVAVECGDVTLTYRELERRANRLAWRLKALGVGPDSLVAVCMEKSADVIAVFLGILKAGGAYVPIDPAYPDTRVAFMLRDSAARVVVTDAALAPRVSAHGADVLLAVDAWRDDAGARDDAPASVARADSLCYVIYTSGSTGQPKGVLIEHRNVVRLLKNARFQFEFTDRDVWTVFHSFAFDFSVWEMYGALLFGGRVIVVPRELAQDTGAYLSVLETRGVTVLNQVPSAFYALMQQELARPAARLALRYVIFGGEALQPALLRDWKARYPATMLVNMFGITETTVHVTYKEIGEREIEDGASNIGRPIPTLTTYVLDDRLQLLPYGATGEICVGGAGVARGYLNRESLTAERFVRHPFRDGERMYRSGDLGRMRPTGEIEYLGRRDAQVKLRGFRIELGEIEAAIAAVPGVQGVAVIMRPDATGEQRLLGYVVAEANASLTPADIRTAIRDRIPEYMVPSVVTMLDVLPVTSNGKVDRAALPEPAAATSRELVPPATPTEEAVANAFADVLQIERVGRTDDFFDLGGHSLLAMRVAGRLIERCGRIVPVRFVFEHSRVDALAAAIDQLAERDDAGRTLTITKAPRVEHRDPPRAGPFDPAHDVFVFPASFAQARLFFLEELEPGRSTYNVPLTARLHGDVDVPALQAALDSLVARHEALRTTFANRNDLPVQVIHPPVAIPISVEDFSAAPDAEAQASSALRAMANRPFDLRHGPVIRVALFRVGVHEHLLLIALHHIAADGWSVGALQRELSEGYAAARAGRAATLEAPAVQYADYTLWQRSELSGDSLASLERYWRTQLQGPLPILELPMRASRPSTIGVRPVGRIAFPFPAELSDRVAALARAERATPFMVILAAFQALLARYSNQDDIIVGTPVSGRGPRELDGVVGLFLNTLALRTSLSDNPSFRALLARVRDVTLGAFTHAALPFERVIDVARVPRNESITPVFQVMFSMQNATAAALDGDGAQLELTGVRVERVGAALESTKYDLQLTLVPDGPAYRGAIEYDATLFDAAFATRLGAHLRNLLDRVLAAPEQPVGDVVFLEAAERERIVRDWNATALAYPHDRDLVALVGDQIARSPGAIALTFEGASLSYGELDQRVGALAAYLQTLGVGPDVVVGLYLERSFEMVVALLAIQRSGGAYLPLDPSYPRDRLEFMVADSGARVIVTQESLRERISLGAAAIISVDGDRDAIDTPRTSVIASSGALAAERLAYLIYTSGSTGKPKGVGVTHRNVVNFLEGFAAAVPIRPGNALLAVTPLSFDIAGLELFLPLTRGARVVIASRDTVVSASALERLMRASGATHMQATPATWRMLVEGGWSRSEGLVALCGGEALQPVLARELLARGVELWNLYGPTEATIWATMHRVEPSSIEAAGALGRPVAIGKPMANVQAYVLDPRGQPVPIDVAGELLLGGDGIARGYHQRPELTAQRFVPDRFGHHAGHRLYRTGDRARWRGDGVLEFLGRFDDQIKLRGFRIELGEIESTLSAQPEVQSSVVLVREDVPGDQRLVAYCVGEDEDSARPAVAQTLSATMRERLRAVLPAYMLPSAFVWLDAWPLTPNGKLDRKALPAPDTSGSANASTFKAPETPVEEIIAGVWRDVLRVATISVDADFFELGGHSLLAMQVVSAVSRLFGREVSLRSFFEHSTIRGMSSTLVAGEETPGRTLALARALVRLRDMSPEERERRRAAATQSGSS